MSRIQVEISKRDGQGSTATRQCEGWGPGATSIGRREVGRYLCCLLRLGRAVKKEIGEALVRKK
jgi:hypothetical protein